jgi:raffinose/stachyose/melibiose transport system permease protein
MNKELSVKRITNSVILAIMSVFALGQLFPLVWLIDFSLNKSGDLFVSGILKWPNPPQFQNYVVAWVQGNIARYLMNSVIVTGSAIILTVVLSLMLGFAFVRMKWKLSGITMAVMLLGMMIPIHATLLPNFFIFKFLGLTDTYQGLIIPYVAVSLPQGIFLLSGFMKSLPRSIEESAVMDGCGVYSIIFKIVLPMMKPAIVTVVIMTFFNCWNEFIMAVTYLSKNELRTLPFSVLNFAGQYSSDYSKQFAVMALSTIPAVIIYFALNEQITKGITMGAVKG